jgi:hypothetical protein
MGESPTRVVEVEVREGQDVDSSGRRPREPSTSSIDPELIGPTTLSSVVGPRPASISSVPPSRSISRPPADITIRDPESKRP